MSKVRWLKNVVNAVHGVFVFFLFIYFADFIYAKEMKNKGTLNGRWY